MHQGLTREQLEEFDLRGVLRLDRFFGEEDIELMLDLLWEDLERRYKLRREQPDSWLVAMVGGFGGSLVREDPRRMEISYHLAEDCHGRGLMREATEVAIPMLWRLLPAETMEAGAQLGNEASFKVMRALGMRPVEERLVYSPIRDQHEPTMFYELRRPSFSAEC